MRTTLNGESGPAIGDIRSLGAGDVLVITPATRERRDWPRVVSAIADAISRGCGVEWGSA